MTIKVRQRTYKETGHVTWQADIHVKLLDGRGHPRALQGADCQFADGRGALGEGARGMVDPIRPRPARPRPPEVKVQKGASDDKDAILRNHLIPLLGEVPLDQIDHAHVQKIKA